MSKVNTQPYKGSRDFYPEDMALRKWMFDKWRRVCERYGYVEYDAPILERTELYLMKGNEEIVSDQTYTFEDRGGRSVTVRTEMTPTVSRMVAGRRQELSYPARWYSIPNLWRYERMQRGRLREFWQLNVDVFGIATEQAEIEMIHIVDDLFQAFKAKRSSYTIKINSRVLVSALLEDAQLTENQSAAAIRLIDRIEKLPTEEFAAQLDSITGDKEISKHVLTILQSNSIDGLPPHLQALDSTKRLQTLLDTCRAHGISNIEFDIRLMRGFDYYTDIVFEVFDTDPNNNRSMFGGGRYDGLVEQFGVDAVPTVGFGMGDVTFRDFLETHGLLAGLRHTTDVSVIVKSDSPEDMTAAASVIKELREMDVAVAVDYTGRKFDKQLKAAAKSGVRHVLFIAPEDIAEGQFTLKDLQSTKQSRHSIHRIVSIVKDTRK